MIVILSNNPQAAVAIKSPYMYRKLTKKTPLNLHNVSNDSVDPLVRSGRLGDICWLHGNSLETRDHLYEKIITIGTFDFFMEMLEKLPPPPADHPRYQQYFIYALRTSNRKKIDFFLDDEKFTPPELPGSLRFLKRDFLLMEYLASRLPEFSVCTKGMISLAMESNNTSFLRKISERFPWTDVRKMVTSRDILVAVFRGYLDVLLWYHETCPCKRSSTLSCMFSDDIYISSLRSRFSYIARWLEEATNCTGTKRSGFRRLSWFHGDEDLY